MPQSQRKKEERKKEPEKEEEKTFLQALISHHRCHYEEIIGFSCRIRCWPSCCLFYAPGDEQGVFSPFSIGVSVIFCGPKIHDVPGVLEGVWVWGTNGSTPVRVLLATTWRSVQPSRDRPPQTPMGRAVLIDQHLVLWKSNRVKLNERWNTHKKNS